jgi:hypothetical protein
MSNPTQIALHTHRNHFLFSDYYLTHRLREQPEWATEVSAALAEFTALWRGYQPQADNESQTEADWIRPVLTKLGHTFNVQAALATPFGTRKPDYILFAAEAGRQAAKAATGPLTGDQLRDSALAVADAKAWDRDLDRAVAAGPGKRGPAISENPMLQIYVYVQHSGLAWGLVTNGRLWRLVHRARADKLDVHYEVDLPALLEQGQAEAFKFFYLFFRREAFSAPPGQTPFLERVLRQSQAYNRGISDNLKDQVYEALRCLAQGFLDFLPNQLEPTPETLRQIYTHSLIVLYRLLFILYAESRALLPVAGPARNPLYSESYSLAALKRRIARDLDQNRPVAASMANDWHALRQLWAVIDQGNPDLEVPAYNGGLFSEPPDGFLSRYRVGDKHLRQAIDLLARTSDPQTQERLFVDYRDLEIRHLGSIYEGLLEYQLRRAEQPLRVRVEKGREQYEPIETFKVSKTSKVWSSSAVTVQAGEVYLITDQGERKATGSYYTPDYIVAYIVEQTLGPVLAELAGRHAGDPAALERAILRLNVLDPSMGSGHFLVEAANAIARRLVELALPKPPDAEFESDLAYWRRRVAQTCIYGVDANPLAVELAKLSLWLATVARGKPLSFLDHHLRHGNSLIGSRVAGLPLEAAGPQRRRQRRQRQQAEAEQRAAGQLSMLDDSAFVSTMRTATGFMDSIERLRGETLAEVQHMAGLYRQVVTEVTAKVCRLADLWTARAFGLAAPEELWPALARYLTHGGLPFAKFDQLVAGAEALARQHHFFHWELEFPEVFFDQHGRLDPTAGFDAVIGNPPYVRQEQMSALKPYLAENFSEVYHGVADIYVYFYRQAVNLLRAGGRMSYIVNNKWLRAGYGAPLRGYFARAIAVEQLVDFGHAPIFPEADTFPCIIVARKAAAQETKEAKTDICIFPREALGQVELAEFVREHRYSVPMTRFSAEPWSLERADVDDLMDKIRQKGVPLREFLGVTPYRGVVTGFNEAFLIDTQVKNKLTQKSPNSAEVIFPYLRGQDVNRWLPDWAELWMIFVRRGIDIEAYPAIKHHLLHYKEQLEPRPKNWTGHTWPGRKPGPYQWFEIQDSVDYWELFTKPKILYQEIQFHPRFALDVEGYFSNNKVFLIPTADLYLLAVLNSPLMWWHNWRYLPHMKDEALTPKGESIALLPVAPPTDEIRSEVEPAVARLIALTGQERQTVAEMLNWLQFEFGIEKPGQKLLDFPALEAKAFVNEVKKQRPRPTGRLGPAALTALQKTFQEYARPVLKIRAEMEQRERQLSDLINQAYQLTPAEIELLWQTAPPRMPVRR